MFKGFKKTISNSHGMTLVEMMVVLAIASIGGYLFATEMAKITQQMELIKSKSGYEEVKNMVRLAALNRTAVQYSATLPGNSDIKDCLLGTGMCTPMTKSDFTLAVGPGNVVASPTSFYSYKGVACSSWGKDCQMKISATAKVVCANGLLKCPYAGGVYLVTKIDIFPAVLNEGYSMGLRPMVETSLLPLEGAEAGHKSVKNYTCGAGTYMYGIDYVHDKPLCRALGQ